MPLAVWVALMDKLLQLDAARAAAGGAMIHPLIRAGYWIRMDADAYFCGLSRGELVGNMVSRSGTRRRRLYCAEDFVREG